MDVLVAIAAKSFLVAGAALLLLRLARRRSAAERSWIAHLGLAAVMLLPVAVLSLPSIKLAAPAFIAAPAAAPEAPARPVVTTSARSKETPSAAGAGFPPAPQPAAAVAPRDWTLVAYAPPALVLLLLTLIALARLISLRGRAEVLVEPHWLTALARAQQRMRFKHGTALLTSDELPSPISWGVMRPVILLNREAAKSHAEAEAIIAHELAHVANFDWAKLMLSRITVAIFWFNPFVWLLSREAHQLREEAADDAVLAADIVDTDYAQLLVGVARHECRGLLIGAHGVAPGRNSLARRVRRVLDVTSARGPAARPFAAGVFVGALAFAAPLAAVTLTPGEADEAASLAASAGLPAADPSKPYYAGSTAPALATTVETSVAAAVAATAHPHPSDDYVRDLEKRLDQTRGEGWHGIGPAPGSVGPRPGTVGPRPGTMVMNRSRGGPQSAIDRAIEMKAVGMTPEYVRAMRAASEQLARLETEEFLDLAALGVSPTFIREMESAGYRNLTADQLAEARAVGVRADYVRSLASVGLRNLPLDKLAELRAVGVTADYIERWRRAGHGELVVEKLIEMRALGLKPEDLYDDGR